MPPITPLVRDRHGRLSQNLPLNNDCLPAFVGVRKPCRLLLVACIVLAMLPLMVGCGGLGQWYRNGFKVGPNYCTPSATTAEHWIDADNPRLKSLETNNAQWWTAFNDPALDYLVASAADENLTLKTAGCRILEARAERGVAAGNLFPQQQGCSGSYSRNALGNGYPFNLFDLGHYYDNVIGRLQCRVGTGFLGTFSPGHRGGRRQPRRAVRQLQQCPGASASRSGRQLHPNAGL